MIDDIIKSLRDMFQTKRNNLFLLMAQEIQYKHLKNGSRIHITTAINELIEELQTVKDIIINEEANKILKEWGVK